MRGLALLLAAALALGGVAAEFVAIDAGTGPGWAVLDLAAGWSLIAAAAVADALRPGCRALLAAAAALWFAGTAGADLWASP